MTLAATPMEWACLVFCGAIAVALFVGCWLVKRRDARERREYQDRYGSGDGAA